MSFLRKREVSIAIMSILVLISMLDFFNYHPTTRAIATQLEMWGIIIAAFTLGLGSLNLILRNIQYVMKRQPGRLIPSIVMLVTMVAMLFFGLVDLNLQHPYFKFIWENIYMPLYSATYGLTGFYIALAMYKGYRLKSIDTGILLSIGFIIIFKNAPIGEAILGKNIVHLGDWIMSVLNTGGIMGLYIGVAMGTIIASLRVIMGKEKGFLGEEVM